MEVKKRNILLKTLPYLRKISKTQNAYLVETFSTLTYTSPNLYHQTFQLIKSNYPDIQPYIENIILPYIHGNVYAPYLYGNLYSPIAPKSKRYYKHSVDSCWQQDGADYYKIQFSPKLSSYQLVEGYLIVNGSNWSIRELFIKGETPFARFSNTIQMGAPGSEEEFLTKEYTLSLSLHLLGNHLSGEYYTHLTYQNTAPPPSSQTAESPPKKYDLSLLYSTQIQAEPFSPSVSFDSLRPVPLSRPEQELIRQARIARDSIQSDTTVKKSRIAQMGKFLINDYSLNMKSFGAIEFSPLLSPVLFNYSSSNGISYAQKLRYTKLFKRDRFFFIEPKIGYNFKEKEFFWAVAGQFDYLPRRNASWTVETGKWGRAGTEKILDDLRALPDTIFDYSKLHLNTFRNIYLRVGHQIEIANGFSAAVLLAIHNYSEVKKSDFTVINRNSPYLHNALRIARHHYTSFIPELQLTWTPGQYYYRDGVRKVNLYSHYPTFSLNWAYAIKGIFNSTTSYHRMEFDMHHKIQLGLVRTLYYRFGMGGFFHYSNLYFADFINFRRSHLPEGWSDKIGGTFQLLSNEKYEGITRYIRGHVQFDTPFLILPSLFKKLPYIMKERLYCNVLYVNTFNPYVEVGYGIGTRLFNIGIFWGGEVNKFNLFGCKFTFEIFNY